MDILLLLLFFMIIFAILGEFPAPQAPGGLQKPFAVEEKFHFDSFRDSERFYKCYKHLRTPT